MLINGRRVAPAGVEGAPTSPDLGLVPSSLVQQYDLLLDGASSIYGSDAVAGVANIIMRKDFDGLEIEGLSEPVSAPFQLTRSQFDNLIFGMSGTGSGTSDAAPIPEPSTALLLGAGAAYAIVRLQFSGRRLMLAAALAEVGINSIAAVARVDREALAGIEGVGEEKADALRNNITKLGLDISGCLGGGKLGEHHRIITG
mgnify:CR=1 FL=1